MIITLTTNPAIDHTVTLDALVPGDTNRVVESRSDPGGKGINVSRALLELGCESLAMGFVAGARGRFVEHALREQGIYTDFLHISGQIRTNITIQDRKHNTTTTLNEPGPRVEAQHVASLLQRVKKQLSPGDWLIIGGSLPPGVDPGFYARVITLAKGLGVRCVLDADGEPLARGIAAQPYLVKPNRLEVERLLGRMPKSREPLLEAAIRIHEAGVAVVVLSEGYQGAVMVTNEGTWRAYPPAIAAVSPVGSGDAMVAGMVQVLSQDGPPEEALRLGVAAGTAAAMTPGTLLCRQADVVRLLPRVQVRRIPRGDRTSALAGAAPRPHR
ncbi:MAG: 1-phosphofructokinase [Chloroflexi bacterium]|nr:1-phosphofructokinase [Chloroflexota bacterium]